MISVFFFIRFFPFLYFQYRCKVEGKREDRGRRRGEEENDEGRRERERRQGRGRDGGGTVSEEESREGGRVTGNYISLLTPTEEREEGRGGMEAGWRMMTENCFI